MPTFKSFIDRRPRFTRVLLWILAVALTLACFTYQDKTGPTQPLEGRFRTSQGEVRYKIPRSQTIGRSLKIILPDPLPTGISGKIRYRRYQSDDAWSTVEMERNEFRFGRHGRFETIAGIGAELPGLEERAGKYEFYVMLTVDGEDPVSLTGDRPIFARYKASVPREILLIHILSIFISMMLAIRTVCEALIGGNFKWMLWATIVSLIIGAFLLGPLVQWYAFGVWWAGIPFGYDWTDNKVLLELVAWIIAAVLNRGKRRNCKSVYIAGLVTLVVYFIPHSLFGSEYNYQTGTGRGTIG